MKSFSERMGLDVEKFQIQKNDISHPLRNALWNNVYLTYFPKSPETNRYPYHTGFDTVPNDVQGLSIRLWINYFNRAIDDEFDIDIITHLVKEEFLKGEYNHVYDLLQFLPNNYLIQDYITDEQKIKNNNFFLNCNKDLKKHLSAYRFINKEIVPITSEEEIESIESALNNQEVFDPVRIHLKAAVKHLSNIKNPDYRNSIKESISAVESYCSIITGVKKASLDNGLAYLEKNHNLSPSLKSAFLKLYGYTSGSNGIRHALLEESNISQEDASYMLVICSAFINYLTAKTN